MFLEKFVVVGRWMRLGLCSSAIGLAALGAEPPAVESTAGVPEEAKPATAEPTAEPTVAPSDALESPLLPDPNALNLSPPPEPIAPSANVVLNLISRLIQKNILTREEAVDLIRQAEAEAAAARAQAEADRLPTSDADVRVTYIPEMVKAQMRAEIKEDVLAQARAENWAAPRAMPDWAPRWDFFGDVRFRYELDMFPDGNDNTGAFPNFNAINTGPPFDVSGTVFAPQHNVHEDRNRMRLRFRFGADVDLGEGFTGGFRIGSGENSSPVSTNQTVGLANQGQGGNFSKYALWIDRAFVKYELPFGRTSSESSEGSAKSPSPPKSANGIGLLWATVGRFDNPFFSTEMIWDEDVGFDGLAMHAKAKVAEGVTPFVTAGAFPVFNTDFNFSTNQPVKFESTDKYLYAVQGGTELKFDKWNARLAAAYYYFDGVEGRLSSPYTPLTAQDAGDTDNTRPSFAQRGNTYRPLRNIVPNALNNFGTTNQFQYFGLATPFREVALTGRLDYNGFEPLQVSLIGEWVKNMAFDRNAIEKVAVNNRGAIPLEPDGTTSDGFGAFEGNDVAWLVGLRVGHPALEKRWAWNAGLGYRYVGSDAVIDGFTDSEFGGGGTNFKGYTLGANLALSPRVSIGATWMSANQIAGPPLKSDVFMFDVKAKF